MSTDKRLTLYDIARLAGTSKSTVSRVLTNHPRVSEATRERVMAVINKHQYSPNPAARGLGGGRKGMIAAISRSISSRFYIEILHGLNETANAQGSHLVSCFQYSTDDYIKQWQMLHEQDFVDGIALISPPAELYQLPTPHAINTVICASRPIDADPSWDQVSTVSVDNRSAYRQLLEALHGQGRRRFIHVAGSTSSYDANERRQAFELFIEEREDCTGEIIQSGRRQENGYEAVGSYLRAGGELPDVFVCFNDSNALGVLQCLRDHDIDGVAVSGHDHESFADLLGFPTIDMPLADIGRVAAEILLQDSSQPVHRILTMTPHFPRERMSVFDLKR